MIIAIPVFGSRVSPRFDCAQEIVIVEEKDGAVLSRKRIASAEWCSADRVSRLAAMGVQVVICGGISGFLVQQLAFRQIRVYSWVSGEAEDALRGLLSGQMESGLMMGPRGPCGRWMLGGGGRRRRGRWGGGPPGWEP